MRHQMEGWLEDLIQMVEERNGWDNWGLQVGSGLSARVSGGQVRRAWKRLVERRAELMSSLTADEYDQAQRVVRKFGSGTDLAHRMKIRNWMLEYSYPELAEVGEYSPAVIQAVNLSVDLLSIWQGDAQVMLT